MAVWPTGSVVAAVKKVQPAVVQVITQTFGYETFLRPVPTGGVGSGVVFDRQGDQTLVLTNYHVVRMGAERGSFIVAPTGGSRLFAQLVDFDPRADLAILRVTTTELPPAPLGDSDALEVGEPVIAIGNALGLPGGPTVTTGVVSAKGRTIQSPEGFLLYDLIQTDAPINPGNSGGPLANLQGEVVGLNTAIIAAAQGIGFAIAINSIKPAIASLKRFGRIVRLYLGVAVTTVTPVLAAQYDLPRQDGALVVGVEPGGPAARAGIAPGDIIIQLGGAAVKTDIDVRREIARRQLGDAVNVVIQRGPHRIEGEVRLEEMPRR